MAKRQYTPFQIPLPIDGLTIEIPLTKGYATTIDAVDADLLNLDWYPAEKEGRVYVWGKTGERINGQLRTIHLHRVIYERMINRTLDSKELVDHWDNDPLNNRRSNLRLADKRRNAQNSKVPSNNALGIKGVYKGTGNFYVASIVVNKTKKSLGCYSTAEEAGAAYNAAAVLYFGEFARLNDIENWQEIAASFERRISMRNTSGFRGVQPSGRRFVAYVNVNKIHVHIGSFGTAEEASRARNEYLARINRNDLR